MSRRARRRNQDGDLERRTERAHRLVQLGELSSARQALEGSDLAPGNRNTLEALQARPGLPRDPLPDDIVGHMPASAFELNEARFCQNLRSSRRGAASGPSGLTNEHLRPLLENVGAMHLFFRLGDQFARAAVPGPIIDALRLGRMTALQKPNGGIRGIVAGDTIRRLVSRTQWPSKWVVQWRRQKLPTSTHYRPVPDASAFLTLSRRCVKRTPETTLVSFDGVSAFDSISREAMLRGLLGVTDGEKALPFVRLFYGRPSQYLWEDDSGNVHTIQQGRREGARGRSHAPLVLPWAAPSTRRGREGVIAHREALRLSGRCVCGHIAR